MGKAIPAIMPDVETVAELRELYRAAEARAARMRLLSSVGKSLSEAQPASIDAIVDQCAKRLAYFLGARDAHVQSDPEGAGIAIRAPGGDAPVAYIVISGIESERDVSDAEDRETLRLYLEFMGAAIDRARRENERQHLVSALQERERRLETLVERMFTVQENERLRVSHDLHDGVAQTATALVRMLEGPGATAPDMPAAERAALAGIARGLVKELRRVIGGLRPTLLDDFGLEAAIRAMGEELRDDGYTVSMRASGEVSRLPKLSETALFRVAQEAISNIRKHAGGPCAVDIDLALDNKGQASYLRIKDNGRGMADRNAALGDAGQHIGIAVMTERMTAIGGRLEWRAGPKTGVEVTAILAATP